MQENISSFINIYEELRQKMKWKVTDTKVLMTIASFYVMNDKPFQMERYWLIGEEIKNQAGHFSYIRSQSRYMAAAILDIGFEQPNQQVPALFKAYDALIEHKFQRSIFTYIAASVLIRNSGSEVKDYGPTIEKAKSIYDGMKKEHRFLTSAEDYPLAILLASQSSEDVIERNERFYENLNRRGFKKGNHLQMLSHILTLNQEENTEVLTDRTVHIFDSFKEVDLKQKTLYYPIMGMLAMIPQEEINLRQMQQVYVQLNQTKQFKWQKDMNAILAASFYIKDRLAASTFIETSLYTTIETILQAQQAAMTAALASSAAASSSSSSGS